MYIYNPLYLSLSLCHIAFCFDVCRKIDAKVVCVCVCECVQIAYYKYILHAPFTLEFVLSIFVCLYLFT